MIRDERQYQIAQDQAERLSTALDRLRQQSNAGNGPNDTIARDQEETLDRRLTDLKEEMLEYQSLRAGEFQWDSLKMIDGLPSILIKARIAQDLGQKELAERAKMKEQQIQKFEDTGYDSATMAQMKVIARALRPRIPNQTTGPH